jgi:hypothetical protein
VSFTNSPIEPAVEWTQSFFPIEKPVAVRAGDRVRAKIQTNNGEVWRWQVEVTDGSFAAAGAPSVKARFDQSTLWNFPVAPEQLKKQLSNYQPTRSRKGEAELYLLGAFDGKRSAAELADDLLERFGDLFPTKASAAKFVSNVVWRCT